jgi:hypothetical protein
MPHDQESLGVPVSAPDRALKRLDPLVGTWTIRGRSRSAQEDNISGRVTIQWLPGGHFLEQLGDMEINGFRLQSLEIVGYDPSTQAFASYVYSSMCGMPARYYWDVQGDVVTHWTEGSKYTGHFSDDGRILSGGWRPDDGSDGPDGAAYDAIMVRVEER